MRHRPGGSSRRFRAALAAADHDFLGGLILDNHLPAQNPAPGNVGINDRAAPDDAAGAENGVASDFRAVTQQRAEQLLAAQAQASQATGAADSQRYWTVTAPASRVQNPGTL